MLFIYRKGNPPGQKRRKWNIWLDYMYDSFLLYPLSFKTTFSVHNFKNMPSVLLVLSFVWFFLKFDLLLCTTTHPVQISDSIRKIFSTMTIWVSLFLTKARLTEKEKGCIIIWLFSIFKFNFLKFFDYISSFNTEKSVFFLQKWFLFADSEIRSLRRNLYRPKLPKLLIMFHTCSLSELFPETDSCISLSSLSSDYFWLKI